MSGLPGYGDRPSWEVSHGKSYLQAIAGRFAGSGLYLLDEAEGLARPDTFFDEQR